MTTMIVLLARHQGWRRLIMVAACSALAATLLLVAVAVLRLPGQPEEGLFPLVADPGLRGGSVLALILLVAPVLLLLHQVVRLGTERRNRRLAALRTIGATPFQVRLLGAGELGLPGLFGAVAGLGLYRLLQAVVGGAPVARDRPFVTDGGLAVPLPGLVPTTVDPPWWQVLFILLAVGGLATLIGWRVTSRAVRSPLDVARRRRDRTPRPWGLLVLAAVLVAYPVALMTGALDSTSTALLLVAIAAVGLLMLGPWLAARRGAETLSRTSDAATLIGAGRLTADPWAAGRAAAPVGLIALVCAGTGANAAIAISYGVLELFFVGSFALVAVIVLGALVLVTISLAVRAVESLAEHRSSTAALAAAGVPEEQLARSITAEARLVARPAAAAGLVLGTLAMLGLVVSYGEATSALIVLLACAGTAVVTLVLVDVAIRIATRIVRPWLRAAMQLDGLRTG